MGKHTHGKARAGPAANPAAFQRSGAAGYPALAALAARHGQALHNVPGDDQCELQALAEHMRPSLKPSQGPTPRAEHIMAAILIDDARRQPWCTCSLPHGPRRERGCSQVTSSEAGRQGARAAQLIRGAVSCAASSGGATASATTSVTASSPEASVVPEILSRSAPKLSSRPHPFDKAAYEAFKVPKSAHPDFDTDSYVLISPARVAA